MSDPLIAYRACYEEYGILTTIRVDGVAITDPVAVAADIAGAVWRFAAKASLRDGNADAVFFFNSTDHSDHFQIGAPDEDGRVTVVVSIMPEDYPESLPYDVETALTWEVEYEPASRIGKTVLGTGEMVATTKAIRPE